MKKRGFTSGAVSIALAVTMLSTTAFAAAASFTDVDSKHWAAPSITEMADRGVMTGVGNNQFAPDKTITYAEFITMVVRQFYEDKLGTDGEKWYSSALAAAESVGILSGTNVSAETTINRYDMAQIMYNVMQEQKMATSSLSDTSKVADWSSVPTAYQDAVSVCYNMGMLSGVDSKGTFNGNGVMTRAQAAVVMDRLIGDEQVAPPAGEVPAGATQITEMSQLLTKTGLEVCDGGFHLNSDLVLYGDGGFGADSRGFNNITFTFQAADLDTRIEFRVDDIDAGYLDPMQLKETVVVKAGETKTFTFNCSSTKAVGLSFTKDGTAGNFAEGWVTSIYLS